MNKLAIRKSNNQLMKIVSYDLVTNTYLCEYEKDGSGEGIIDIVFPADKIIVSDLLDLLFS